MGNLAYESDSAFFNLIHRQVIAQKRREEVKTTVGDGDRRELPRAAFYSEQLIAPNYCGRVPPLSAFIKVRSYDLNGRGFAFLLDQHPNFDQFVALFRVPSAVYVTARLTFARPVLVAADGSIASESPADSVASAAANLSGGTVQFLVGSEFVQRLPAVTESTVDIQRLVQ